MIYLVLGGSGSGKSEYAEGLTMKAEYENKIYIATMQPFDDEALAKIARHREMRKHKGFDTIECQVNLESVNVQQGSMVLLECISNLVANEMYSPEGSHEKCVEAIITGIKHLLPQCGNLIFVSNNVFTDGDSYDPSTLEYIENMARVNNFIASISDEVVEVVHGIPIISRGEK